MSINKIVITGGPCAGKTTALSRIQNSFTKIGYTVLFISEIATEIIGSGITANECPTALDFQEAILRLQLAKEEVYLSLAEKMSAAGKKVLLVCDRGALDNKAYMPSDVFEKILSLTGKNETELRDGYDGVFHLVSAAKGAEEYYTLENNNARRETCAEAASLDDKIISAWTGHPHLRVIDNSSDFENKIMRLVKEISAFLGEPEPYETERKFLIEYPDLRLLESLPNCRRVEIIQTYLKSPEGEEWRVRQRGENGNYIYFQTVKRKISPIKRIEIEKRLTMREYLDLLMDSDTSKRQIRKSRYCLTYNSLYFEIDVYPFWSDRAICEIELSDENTQINFPEFIKVIKEVTEDESYKNASLAKIRDLGSEAIVTP